MQPRTHRGFPLAMFPLLLVACTTAQGDTPKEATAKKAPAMPAAQAQHTPPFKQQVDGLISALNQTMVKTGDNNMGKKRIGLATHFDRLCRSNHSQITSERPPTSSRTVIKSFIPHPSGVFGQRG